MNAINSLPANAADLQADRDAVMAHFLSGQPLDPVVAERVRARAQRITEDLRRQYGEMNIAVDLIRESRDEANRRVCERAQSRTSFSRAARSRTERTP
jgi:hypothetical protein